MVFKKIYRQVKSTSLTGKSDKLQYKYSFSASDRHRRLIQALNSHIAQLKVIIDEQEITAFDRQLPTTRDRPQAIFKPKIVLDLHLQVATADRAFEPMPQTKNPAKDLFRTLLSGRLQHPVGMTVGWSELVRSVRLTANLTQRSGDDRADIDTSVDGSLVPVIEDVTVTATVAQNHLAPFSPQIMGTSTRLQQVLRQLLSHTVKSTQLDKNG